MERCLARPRGRIGGDPSAERRPACKVRVDHAVRFERILQNEVILVALPLVGESVGEDAEIATVAWGLVGVAGEAILEPTVGPERDVLQTKCPFRKRGVGA
jgi:hypothetical protein